MGVNKPPDIIPFTGDWSSYEEKIYRLFKETLVKPEVSFRDHKVTLRRHPESKQKHYSFWHITSKSLDPKNYNEDDRIPDIRRCERILWVRWLIDNYQSEEVTWWENKRGHKTNTVIWYRRENFAVVLQKRSEYYMLLTAYMVERHRENKFLKELKSYNEKARTP